MANALRDTLGSADVRVDQASGLPTLTVTVDPFATANYGLSAVAIGGAESGQIFEGDRRFEVVVRLNDTDRNNARALSALPITTAEGVPCLCRRWPVFR